MSARERWPQIADASREQMLARIAADPRLEQWRVGPGPRGPSCVYAALSERHAEAMHRVRMSSLIQRRKRADEERPRPPHLDAPYCPQCAGPFGTLDGPEWLRMEVVCSHCGHMWESAVDHEQARRADVAYAAYRAEEEQRELDARRLGPELLALNDAMIAEAAKRIADYKPAQQLGLLR